MRAAGERSHRRGIPEGAAQRRRGKQRRVGRIEADAAGDVGGVPGDGLLIVPEVVKVRQGVSPAASSGPASAVASR
jgi:hypothetical protein